MNGWEMDKSFSDEMERHKRGASVYKHTLLTKL